jgi:uncharacterized protein (TIGR02246 family)
MKTWVLLVVGGLLAQTASADPTGEARAHAEAFARACQAGDVAAVMSLYADDAVVIWPGHGQEAKGRAEIERLVSGLCTGRPGTKLVLESIEALPLDDTHLATVGRWQNSSTGPRGQRLSRQVRTTEVLVKRDGKWRYLIDHASVGVRPPRPAPSRRERRER